MQGALADTSPTELWLRLSGQAATGSLLLTGPRGEASVRFVHGQLAAAHAPTASGTRGIRLGERLVHAGRLDRPDLEEALAAQSESTSPVALGQVLVDQGLVGADAVRLFLQEQLLEAITEMIGWTSGRYAFEVTAETGAHVPVTLPVARVLVEVRRRAEERALVRTRVPGPTAVPTPMDTATARPRLSADAFTVLTAVDGLRTVGAIASALGYGYTEASRVVYRLALQGLVTIADTDGRAEASIEDPTTSMTTQTGPLADEGWADQRHAVATVDEPEPWVGWAHGSDDSEPEAPAAEAAAEEPAARQEDPAPGTTSDWLAMDYDTREALFSELHAVNRGGSADDDARPAPTSPSPAPEPEVTPEAEDTAPDEQPDRPDDSVIGDVSDLLRELHALNLDDDGK